METTGISIANSKSKVIGTSRDRHGFPKVPTDSCELVSDRTMAGGRGRLAFARNTSGGRPRRDPPAPPGTLPGYTSRPPEGRAVIREFRPEDRDALLAVWADSAAVAYPFWTPAMFEQERQDIAEKFLPVAETYVFESSGAVVGFISLLGNEVGGIFVVPEYHRQGVGRALLEWARGSRGQLELDVFEANEIGRAFYAACGFGVVGERVDEATGLRILRLRLPSANRG